MALNPNAKKDETYSQLSCMTKIMVKDSSGDEITYAIKDMTSRKHISDAEVLLEENPITDLASRIDALENNTSTSYDDSALVKRIEILEQNANKDNTYDDTTLVKRIEALEKKEDKDTVYNDAEIKEEIRLLNDAVDKLAEKARIYDTALGITDTAAIKDSLIIETKSSSGIKTSEDRKPHVFDPSTATDQGFAQGAGYAHNNDFKIFGDTSGNNIFKYIGGGPMLGNVMYITDVDDTGYSTLVLKAISNNEFDSSIKDMMGCYKALPIRAPYIVGEFAHSEKYEYGEEPALWNTGIAYSGDFREANAEEINHLLNILVSVDSDKGVCGFDEAILSNKLPVVLLSSDGILSIFDKDNKVCIPLAQYTLIGNGEILINKYLQSKAVVEERLQAIMENENSFFMFSLRYNYLDEYSEIKARVNTVLLDALGIDYPTNTNLVYTYKHNKSGGVLGIGGSYNSWSASDSNPDF